MININFFPEKKKMGNTFHSSMHDEMLDKTYIDDREWLTILEEDLMNEEFINIKDKILASSTLDWWEQRSMTSLMGLKKLIDRKKSVDSMIGYIDIKSENTKTLSIYLSNLRMEFLGTAKNCSFINQITKRLNILSRMQHAMLRQNKREKKVRYFILNSKFFFIIIDLKAL